MLYCLILLNAHIRRGIRRNGASFSSDVYSNVCFVRMLRIFRLDKWIVFSFSWYGSVRHITENGWMDFHAIFRIYQRWDQLNNCLQIRRGWECFCLYLTQLRFFNIRSTMEQLVLIYVANKFSDIMLKVFTKTLLDICLTSHFRRHYSSKRKTLTKTLLSLTYCDASTR